MKFYKLGKDAYTSICNAHSKYWEIQKGYKKYPSVEITKISSFGFGWDTQGKSEKEIYGLPNGKTIFTKKEFIGWLLDRRTEYEYMLEKINNTILSLHKGEL